jgi:hypothetical protein
VPDPPQTRNPHHRLAGKSGFSWTLSGKRLAHPCPPRRQPHFGQRNQQPPIADVMTSGQPLLPIQGQYQFADLPLGGEID